MFLFYKDETFPQKITADPKEIPSWGIPQVNSVEESKDYALALFGDFLFQNGVYLGVKKITPFPDVVEMRKPIAACDGYAACINTDRTVSLSNHNGGFDTAYENWIGIIDIVLLRNNTLVGIDLVGNLKVCGNSIVSGHELTKRALAIPKAESSFAEEFAVLLEDYSLVYFVDTGSGFVQYDMRNVLAFNDREFISIHRNNRFDHEATYNGVTFDGEVFPKVDIRLEDSVYQNVKKLLVKHRSVSFAVLYKDGTCYSNAHDLSSYSGIKDIAAVGDNITYHGYYLLDSDNVLHYKGTNDQYALHDGDSAVCVTGDADGGVIILRNDGIVDASSITEYDAGNYNWTSDMSVVSVQ